MPKDQQSRRPLSPHLQIYRPLLLPALSIFHRLTGIALGFGGLLLVWWLVAAASGPGYFAFVDGLMTSFLGDLVMAGLSWALAYHLLNGIRHLVWDTGHGFEIETAERSGLAVVAGSGLLAIILWIVA